MKRKLLLPLILIPLCTLLSSWWETIDYVTGQYTGSGSSSAWRTFASGTVSSVSVYANCTNTSPENTDIALSTCVVDQDGHYTPLEAHMGDGYTPKYSDICYIFIGHGIAIDYNLQASGYSTTAWIDINH
jgi:hypothetical protein